MSSPSAPGAAGLLLVQVVLENLGVGVGGLLEPSKVEKKLRAWALPASSVEMQRWRRSAAQSKALGNCGDLVNLDERSTKDKVVLDLQVRTPRGVGLPRYDV